MQFMSKILVAHQPRYTDQDMDLSRRPIVGHQTTSIGPDGCWASVKNYKLGLELHPTQRVLATYGENGDKCNVVRHWETTNIYVIEMDLSPDEGACTVQLIDKSGKIATLDLTCSPG